MLIRLTMKSWKKKLLWPLVVVALSLAASQTVLAFDADDDGEITVPDGGATALLLVGACLGIEAVRRKFNRS